MLFKPPSSFVSRTGHEEIFWLTLPYSRTYELSLSMSWPSPRSKKHWTDMPEWYEQIDLPEFSLQTITMRSKYISAGLYIFSLNPKKKKKKHNFPLVCGSSCWKAHLKFKIFCFVLSLRYDLICPRGPLTCYVAEDDDLLIFWPPFPKFWD